MFLHGLLKINRRNKGQSNANNRNKKMKTSNSKRLVQTTIMPMKTKGKNVEMA